jgi:hypothetical protein
MADAVSWGRTRADNSALSCIALLMLEEQLSMLILMDCRAGRHSAATRAWMMGGCGPHTSTQEANEDTDKREDWD